MVSEIATVLNAVESRLSSICSKYGDVSKGMGRFRAGTFPKILVSATKADFEIARTVINSAHAFSAYIVIDVAVICRDTEPDDWHTDVISVMGKIFDEVCNENTLQGAVDDLVPLSFEAGRISITGTEGASSKIYYGGLMQFRARAFYTA